ncbi:MAG TPA: sugar-binding protein, partial [Kofleriaceae bacterium]
LLNKGFLDATLYPGVDPTGATDSRGGLQAAIDDGFTYAIPVYLPAGTYLVKGPLTKAQLLKPNYDQYSTTLTPQGGVIKSPVLVGASGAQRPKIVLANNASGFNDPANPKAVLDFHAQDSTGTMSEENIAGSAMGLIVRNVEIDVGTGNAGAVGLQVPSAQMSNIEDVKIDATGGYAGLRWVVSVNTMVNIEVTGGRYGVITDTCCGINITGLVLRDQTDAGLLVNSSASVVINGFDISETTATPVSMTGSTPVRGELSLHDGQINSASTSVVIDNKGSRTLYVQDVFVNSGGPLVANGTAKVAIPTGSWQTVAQYVFTEAPGSVTRNDGTKFTASTTALLDGTLAPTTGLALGTAEDPPADLATLHSWKKLPSFEDAHDAHDLGVTGDGVTDDTDALQAAIDTYDAIFLPRGDYKLTRQLRLHAHTKLIAPPGLSVRLCPNWDPAATLTHAVITDDAPDGDAQLLNIGIKLRTGYANSYMGALEWKVGRKSLVNELTIWMPYEDLSAPMGGLSAARSLVAVSAGGGGRWYGLTLADAIWRSSNTNSRSLSICGTTEPLTLYGANLEHNRSQYSIEIANATNVRMYGSKTESGTFIYCHGSHNLLFTGIVNREDPIIHSEDCDGVLAANIQDYSWELGGPVISETFNGTTVTYPQLVEASLFTRGSYDPSAFTGITSPDGGDGDGDGTGEPGPGEGLACTVDSAPTIDGDASDWSDIARTPITTSVEGAAADASDLSAQFATTTDGTNLYVLVEVTDDTVVTDSSPTNLSIDDSVEVYLDGTHAQGASFGAHDFQLTVDASGRVGGVTADALQFTSATKTTDTGYVVEYSVPLAAIGATSTSTIGFDVAINDNDATDDARDAQLFWVGNATSWQTPSSWGSLALTETNCKDVPGNGNGAGDGKDGDGGCSTSGTGGGLSLIGLLLVGLRRRRR